MGMDVRGVKPTDKVGLYYGRSIWTWKPLWTYCLEVAPKIAGKVATGHFNDGDGLNDADAKALAAVLRKALDSGAAAKAAEASRTRPRLGAFDAYKFAVEDVWQFAVFLEHCGGFEIW